jgi:hypothetical protein
MENIIKFIQEDTRIKLDFDPKKYEMVNENGEFYLKKKIYPSNFMDAMEILKIDSRLETKYKELKVFTFQRLLILRDAYWEAYSREHNFNNRWKPDYNDVFQDKYAIVSKQNKIYIKKDNFENQMFVFPTNELAYLFMENFREMLANYF